MSQSITVKLTCLLLRHRLHVKQHFGRHARRVECLRCGSEWAMNDNVQSFLPWDEEFAELYRSLGHTVLK